MRAAHCQSTLARHSQSINPYSYIGNNPLSGIDPTGYAPCDDAKFCPRNGTLDEDGKYSTVLNNAKTDVIAFGGSNKSNGKDPQAQTPSSPANGIKAPGSESKSSDTAPGPSSRPLVNDGLLTLEYTTHIPAKRVTDPLKGTFGGDGHDFDPTGTYRSRQTVVINSLTNEIVFSTSDTGKSYRINPDTDEVTAARQADPVKGFEARGPIPLGDTAVFVISGHVVNPLATLNPTGGVGGPNYSPGIDYELTVVHSKGTVTVFGSHDQFPAHNLSINGQSVYRFDPRAAGTSAGYLFPFMPSAHIPTVVLPPGPNFAREAMSRPSQ